MKKQPDLLEAKVQEAQNADGFLTSPQLARKLQVSVSTIGNWRKWNKIPFIQCPGRSVRFHWPSVESALLRQQRGGVQ